MRTVLLSILFAIPLLLAQAPATQPTSRPATATAPAARTTFCGIEDRATRVVFILDCSGSLIDNFSFLQQEVIRAVKALDKDQFFAVIVFAGEEEGAEFLLTPSPAPASSRALGGKVDSPSPALKNEPATPKILVPATDENKRSVTVQMNNVIAHGHNDDQLEPFLQSFKLAFATKPEVIYFLTDGRFDKRLNAKIKELNPNAAVRINTIAFVKKDEPEYQEQLRALAKANGGTFKFIAETDLGR